jgi:hypothetical protein
MAAVVSSPPGPVAIKILVEKKLQAEIFFSPLYSIPFLVEKRDGCGSL